MGHYELSQVINTMLVYFIQDKHVAVGKFIKAEFQNAQDATFNIAYKLHLPPNVEAPGRIRFYDHSKSNEVTRTDAFQPCKEVRELRQRKYQTHLGHDLFNCELTPLSAYSGVNNLKINNFTSNDDAVKLKKAMQVSDTKGFHLKLDLNIGDDEEEESTDIPQMETKIVSRSNQRLQHVHSNAAMMNNDLVDKEDDLLALMDS